MGDFNSPSPELVSSIWWRSWAVGEIPSSTLQAAGLNTVGDYVWTLSGNVPPGLTIAPISPGAPLARFKTGFTSPGTYSMGIQVFDNRSKQTASIGPFDVVVGAAFASIPASLLRGATVGSRFDVPLTVTGGTPLAPCLSLSPSIFECVSSQTSSGTTFTITGIPSAPDTFSLDIRIATDVGPAFQKVRFVIRPPIQLTFSEDFTPVLGNLYVMRFSVATNTGTGPYSFSITGFLPAGMLTETSNEKLEVRGIMFSVGTSEFTVTVNDIWGSTALIKKRVVVTDKADGMEIALSPPPVGRRGSYYFYQLGVLNPTYPITWTIASGTLPDGLVLSTLPYTAKIVGIPRNAGTSTVTLSVTDSHIPAVTKTASVTITIQDAPGILAGQPSLLPTAYVGIRYSVNLTAVGGTPPYTWSPATMQSDFTLSNDGTLTGIPTSSRVANIQATVTDSTGASATLFYSVPTLSDRTPVVLKEATVGESYYQEVQWPSGFFLALSDWKIADGNLPPGLQVASDYYPVPIVGTPRSAGEFFFSIQGIDSTGTPFARPFSLIVKSAPGLTFYSMADRASLPLSTPGTSPDLKITYGRFQGDESQATVSGAAFIQFRSGGVLVSETTVRATEAISAGRVFAEITDTVNTGLAIANVDRFDNTIELTYRDLDGKTVGTATVLIPINVGQVAAFLDQPPFNVPRPFIGTVTFFATRSVAVTALRGLTNERSNFLLTTLPVVPYTTTLGASLIPHFAAGGGWTTQLALVNPSPGETLRGTIEFIDPGTFITPGQPISLTVNGQSGTSFNYLVPPDGSEKFIVTLPGNTIRVGSVRINPVGSPGPDGLLTYSYMANGVTSSETGIELGRVGESFRLFAENSQDPRVQTGIAIANPSAVTATVQLQLADCGGNVIGTANLTVPGNGQVARYLNEIPELEIPSNFQGLLVITGLATGIAVTGIRGHYNERGEYFETSIVAVDAAASSTRAEKFFPHLVDGAGYKTKVVLFSGNAAQTGTGALSTADTSRNPADIFISSAVPTR
jgi:hypothetical protein